MSQFPLGYDQIPTATWVYVSSLLMIGLFFKFNRVWSMRNLDLILLVLLSPGLLMVHFGRLERQVTLSDTADAVATPVSSTDDLLPIPLDSRDALQSDSTIAQPSSGTEVPPVAASDPGVPPRREAPTGDPISGDALSPEALTPETTSASADSPIRGERLERYGFLWLFCVAGLFLLRMLIDPMMVRRPLLEPNLSIGGLAFISCALLVFLMANVVTSGPTADDLSGRKDAAQWMPGEMSEEIEDRVSRRGPGYPLIHELPGIITTSLVADKELPRDQRQLAYAATAKTMAILAHLAVVMGIVVIGYRHFDNIKMGVGVAALYLMLPYTAQMTGRVDHVLPAALLVWAVLWYRRPLAAGLFLGLAIGVFYYPLFLLPLWISFYWHRGLMRFVTGAVLMLAAAILSLAYTSSGAGVFLEQLRQTFGFWLPVMEVEDLHGVWGPGGWYPVYRLPVLAAFVALSGTLAVWPAQKNLGTLLSCSAAIMIATQFWHGFGGGLYVAWYLPLALLTFFRPNLEDRVALSVLGEGWFRRRRQRAQKPAIDKAA